MAQEPARDETTELQDEIRRVLREATDKSGASAFVTSYQIFQRLNPALRARLVQEHGLGGAGGGVPYSAMSAIGNVASKMPDVATSYLSTNGIQLEMEGRPTRFEPGYKACGIFRLEPVRVEVRVSPEFFPTKRWNAVVTFDLPNGNYDDANKKLSGEVGLNKVKAPRNVYRGSIDLDSKDVEDAMDELAEKVAECIGEGTIYVAMADGDNLDAGTWSCRDKKLV